MPPAHTHDWREIGRVFPFSDEDFDVERLSPEGGHHPDVDGGSKLLPPTHPKLKGKVPAPTPHLIVQCADLGCPDGPKHTVHWELTKAEFDRLKKLYENGALDPDANGTNRLISQASLDDLGLGRLAAKLSDEGRRSSGAREDLMAGLE